MKTISLTAQDLFHWLAQQGGDVRDSFWPMLENFCDINNTYEHQFYINCKNGKWVIMVNVLFISSHKLWSAGWISKIDAGRDNSIFVGTIVMKLVPAQILGSKTNQYITPILQNPELGVRIETPTIKELDIVWNSLTNLAPTVSIMVQKISFDLGVELSQGIGD